MATADEPAPSVDAAGGEAAAPAPAPAEPAPGKAGGAEKPEKDVDWMLEELGAMKRFEENMQERRKEMDRYDRRRREEMEEWEKKKMDEVVEMAKKRSEGVDQMIKEAEDRYKEMVEKNRDLERRLGENEQVIERRYSLLKEDVKEFEDRKRKLEEEKAFAAASLSKITDQQVQALKEVNEENEKLRAKYMQQADEVVELRAKLEQLPELQRVIESAQRIEKNIGELRNGGGPEYKTSPHFAPVLAWLAGLGLGRFADVFAENEYDLQSASALTETDLDAMHITSLGPRRRLLIESRALKEKMSKDRGFPDPTAPVAAGLVSSTEGNGNFTLEKVLRDFYVKYDPAKVPQVAMILQKFHGKYDELFATLASIYPIYFPSPYRDRTLMLLRKVAPELLAALDVLLDLYQDREIEMLAELLRASEALHSELVPGCVVPTYGSTGLSAAGSKLPPPPPPAATPPLSWPSPTPHAATPYAPSIQRSPYTAATTPAREPIPALQAATPKPPVGIEPSVAHHALVAMLQKQGVPNPESVAQVLGKNFSGREDVLLKAFHEVDQGVKPALG